MLSHKTFKRQQGISLVELMIGMLIGLIVVAGASALYLNTSQSSLNTQRQFRLNQEIRGVMDIMTQDLKRAGYWSNALSSVSGTMNPFSQRGTSRTDLYVSGPDLTHACWLYSYDATFNTSHAINTVDGYAFYGFRLNNNTIQMLPDNSGLSDTSVSCDGLAWQALTDSTAVTVDALSLTMTYQCLNTANVTTTQSTACTNSGDVEIRQADIFIQAHHTRDSGIQIAIHNTVTLPNNRIVP